MSERWGGTPVGLPSGRRWKLRPEGPAAPPPFTAVVPARTFPVADLVRSPDRANRAAEALKHWRGTRLVTVASVAGGAGVTTLTAALWWRLRDIGPTVALAAAGRPPGVFARRCALAPASSVSWSELASLDPAGLAAALAPDSIDDVLMVPNPLHSAPVEVIAAVARTAVQQRPLVLVDAGGLGAGAVLDLVHGTRPDLLVMVSRDDEAEVRDSADFLREVRGNGSLDTAQAVVVCAVHEGRSVSRATASAGGAVREVAAGMVTLRRLDAWRPSGAAVGSAGQKNTDIDLLAAAIATAQPRKEPTS